MTRTPHYKKISKIPEALKVLLLLTATFCLTDLRSDSYVKRFPYGTVGRLDGAIDAETSTGLTKYYLIWKDMLNPDTVDARKDEIETAGINVAERVEELKAARAQAGEFETALSREGNVAAKDGLMLLEWMRQTHDFYHNGKSAAVPLPNHILYHFAIHRVGERRENDKKTNELMKEDPRNKWVLGITGSDVWGTGVDPLSPHKELLAARDSQIAQIRESWGSVFNTSDPTEQSHRRTLHDFFFRSGRIDSILQHYKRRNPYILLASGYPSAITNPNIVGRMCPECHAELKRLMAFRARYLHPILRRVVDPAECLFHRLAGITCRETDIEKLVGIIAGNGAWPVEPCQLTDPIMVPDPAVEGPIREALRAIVLSQSDETLNGKLCSQCIAAADMLRMGYWAAVWCKVDARPEDIERPDTPDGDLTEKQVTARIPSGMSFASNRGREVPPPPLLPPAPRDPDEEDDTPTVPGPHDPTVPGPRPGHDPGRPGELDPDGSDTSSDSDDDDSTPSPSPRPTPPPSPRPSSPRPKSPRRIHPPAPGTPRPTKGSDALSVGAPVLEELD